MGSSIAILKDFFFICVDAIGFVFSAADFFVGVGNLHEGHLHGLEQRYILRFLIVMMLSFSK